MLVREVMDKSAAVCVPFDTAKAAATIMKRYDIGFIPVAENEPAHTYIGAVTDRSLCLQVIAEGLDSARTQLAECVSYQNAFCRPDDPIEKALQTMRKEQMNALAVLDCNRNVAGVVWLHELEKWAISGNKIVVRSARPKQLMTASSSANRATHRVR